jgi:membrane dipeptidase
MISRRALLAAAAAAAVAPAYAKAPPRLVIDGLGGIDDPNVELMARLHPEAKPATQDRLSPRVLADLRRSGISAVNVTLGYVSGPADPFEASVKGIADCDRMIRANPDMLVKVLAASDIERAHKRGKVGLIYGFQNAVQLGGKVERVDLFADLGLRILQLTYNPANELGGGSQAGEIGLSEFGRAVVARANEKRVLIDLSHSGERICLDAARASSRPITISHTGCRALHDVPRNKTDEEMRLVAEGGGVVGIYFMPFLVPNGRPLAADVIAHLEHAIKVCGEDHVAIGTDGGVSQIDNLDDYRLAIRKEQEERVKAGVAAAGESGDVTTFVMDLRGPGEYRRLGDLLAARGHSAARIDKILGLNLLRLYREVWAG